MVLPGLLLVSCYVLLISVKMQVLVLCVLLPVGQLCKIMTSEFRSLLWGFCVCTVNCALKW